MLKFIFKSSKSSSSFFYTTNFLFWIRAWLGYWFVLCWNIFLLLFYQKIILFNWNKWRNLIKTLDTYLQFIFATTFFIFISFNLFNFFFIIYLSQFHCWSFVSLLFFLFIVKLFTHHVPFSALYIYCLWG